MDRLNCFFFGCDGFKSSSVPSRGLRSCASGVRAVLLAVRALVQMKAGLESAQRGNRGDDGDRRVVRSVTRKFLVARRRRGAAFLPR